LAYPARAAWPGPDVAQLDSGADFTIGPLSLVRAVNAPLVRPATLSSPWGEPRSVYEVDLRIGLIVLPAVDLAGVLAKLPQGLAGADHTAFAQKLKPAPG